MIEAKVVCLCKRLYLQELSLELVQGDEVWVSEQLAQTSPEIDLYRKNGALRVEYLERVKEMAGGFPSPSWRGQHQLAPVRQKNSRKEPQQTPEPDEGSNELIQEIRKLRAVCEQMAHTLQIMAEQQVTLAPILKSIQGLQETMKDLSAGSTKPISRSPVERVAPSPRVETESVFLPSNLVDKTKSVSVSSASGNSSNDLEDSAAQLRALKKGGL